MSFIFLSFEFLFLTLIAFQTVLNKSDIQVKLYAAHRTVHTTQTRKWVWQLLWNIKRFVNEIFTQKVYSSKHTQLEFRKQMSF